MHPEDALDAVDKAALKDSEGRLYRQFRSTLRPRYLIVWRDILVGYGMVATGLAAAMLAQRAAWWAGLVVLPVATAFVGFWLAYLNLFTHEAAHHNLASNRHLNDILANICLSVLFGMSIRDYRQIHWDHHRLHGTTDDTENSYFHAFTSGFLLRALVGVQALEVMWSRRARLQQKGTAAPAGLNLMLFAGLLVNGLLLAGLVLQGYGMAAAAWAGGMLLFYPFFNAVRQLLEHRDEEAGPARNFSNEAHGRINRLFGDSLLAQTLGGAGFNRHLLHHWEPTVSYTRLMELEEFLSRTPVASILEARRTTYATTATKLFRRGRQWSMET